MKTKQNIVAKDSQCQIGMVSQGCCRNRIAVIRVSAANYHIGLCSKHDAAHGDVIGRVLRG